MDKDKQSELEHDKKYGVYWKNGDPTPFCQNCYEKESKPIHLTRNEITVINNDPTIYYECKNCRAFYEIKREDVKDL